MTQNAGSTLPPVSRYEAKEIPYIMGTTRWAIVMNGEEITPIGDRTVCDVVAKSLNAGGTITGMQYNGNELVFEFRKGGEKWEKKLPMSRSKAATIMETCRWL